MAKEIANDLKVTVNAVDLSDHAYSVEMSDSADEVDVSAFSASQYREYMQGLKDSTVTIGFFNDHASASVADTIQALYTSGTAFPVKVWPNRSGTVVYTQQSRVYTNPLFNASIGDPNTVDVVFRNGGTVGITRGTS